MLDAEHFPGAGKARLDLVGNEQDAVAVANSSQGNQKLRRRRQPAAFALHRLDDDRGHVAGVDIDAEKLIERL